ncbi:galactonate dehydratase [Occultella glacieicola]|uniref:Galactonate dehydratase n=1 Tax=Occultella glacieicola TaxID=2518684 RepID=A0ABY2E889_9MICO|nr:galactonate dehydratase [Occultella glacieicola]TDE98720.1 galactonate dehydratase [Occultella glacieicola]
MRIVDIETFQVPPRWLFVRLATDEGVVGWGEPIVEGRAEAVQAGVDILAEYLIGKDPLRIADHWQVMSKSGFYRGGPVLSSAVAGLDQALWDIAGKARGVPVHELLGGPVRDRVRVYTAAHGDTPADVADHAARLVADGFTAVKVTPTGRLGFLDDRAAIRGMHELLDPLRDALGDADLAMDLHGRFSLPMARRVLPLLAEYLPLFIEEPVLPEYTVHLGRLTAATSAPIATGERLYSVGEFRLALDAGISVAQPDLSHAGGISETMRIAALASAYDVALAPHCPLGPIALASCLQIGFTVPNYLIQELPFSTYDDAGDAPYLTDPGPLRINSGHIERLTGPGLGIDIDEAAVRAAAAQPHRWRPPLWRHDDGSFAEW